MRKIFIVSSIFLIFALIFISQGIGEDQLLEKNFRIAGQKYVPGAQQDPSPHIRR